MCQFFFPDKVHEFLLGLFPAFTASQDVVKTGSRNARFFHNVKNGELFEKIDRPVFKFGVLRPILPRSLVFLLILLLLFVVFD